MLCTSLYTINYLSNVIFNPLTCNCTLTSNVFFIFCTPDIDKARQTRFPARHVIIEDCRDLVMLQKNCGSWQ